MQAPKSRLGSLEPAQKKSSVPAPKVARRLKTESDSKTKTTTKTQTPKVVADRSSPRIPLNEIQKKRLGRIPELESQISQLQEELQKTKEELNRSDALRKEAEEINASEDSRIEELRKLSQERDKTWQSELEAMQRQHGLDSVALSSAINEVQKLKSMLFESESELEQSKLEVESLEKLLEEERDTTEAAKLKEEIKRLKSAVEAAETRYQEEYINSTLQIRNAYEETETVKSRFAEELKKSRGEIEDLRKRLADKSDLKRLEMDLMEARGELMEKEMELQSLRSEMEKKEETSKTEAMEGELRRVKVQCEQWRKAAETAASILNNDEERTESIENGNVLKKFGVLRKKKP